MPGLFDACPPAGYVCVRGGGGGKAACCGQVVVCCVRGRGRSVRRCALMLHECARALGCVVTHLNTLSVGAGMVQLAEPSGQALCEQQQTPRQPLRGPLHALQPCHLSCWVMWLPLLMLAWLSGCAACLAPWGVPRCAAERHPPKHEPACQGEKRQGSWSGPGLTSVVPMDGPVPAFD